MNTTWSKRAWWLQLVGLLIVAWAIWLAGPYLHLDGLQPLAAPVSRWLAILSLVMMWLGWWQFQLWRDRPLTREPRRASSAPLSAETEDSGRVASEQVELRANFRDAVQWLRARHPGEKRLNRLPWYVVLGAAGSGKSSLLQQAGLDFPAEEVFTHLRHTGYCDWWVAEQAVFIDPAGRYVTQHDDPLRQLRGWQACLTLWRRYRRRVNGVVVVVSAAAMLHMDETARLSLARSLRRRLQEVTGRLQRALPIYLMLSQCDAMEGFGDYFAPLDSAARRQGWGITLSLKQSVDGRVGRHFAEAFRQLRERLDARLFEQLHASPQVQQRATLLAFPEQLAAFGERLRIFVEELFATSAADVRVLFRGVYFSGAVVPDVTPQQASPTTLAGRPLSFFTEGVWKEVIFKEIGVLKLAPLARRRQRLLQGSLLIGIMLGTALLIDAMAGSYTRNKHYLLQLETLLENQTTALALGASAGAQTKYEPLLDYLDALRALADAANPYHPHAPFAMRYGLYQGKNLRTRFNTAYQDALQRLLLPILRERFRLGIQHDATNPETLYHYLQAYLMLGQPSRAHAKDLQVLAELVCQQIFPAQPALQAALAKHFQTLLAKPGLLPPQRLDQGLVAQARSTLRLVDPAVLIYSQLKLDSGDAPYPALRLDKALGLQSTLFHRQSGVPLAKPIAALYTQPMFAYEITVGISQAVARFVRQDLVLGKKPISRVQQLKLEQQVQQRYEHDYIDAWDDVLKDLQLPAVSTIQQAGALAAKLGGSGSPLKLLLKLVAQQTSHLLPGSGFGTYAKSTLALPSATPVKPTEALKLPGQAIQNHFALLDQFGATEQGSAPVDRVLHRVMQSSSSLLAASDPSAYITTLMPVLALTQQTIAVWPVPLSTWMGALMLQFKQAALDHMSGALRQQVQQTEGDDCTFFTTGRYPFDLNSKSDIPLQNFAELFGNGGRFDTLYKQSLGKWIDTRGQHWQWRQAGASTSLSHIPQQLQLAEQIKQAFFRDGKQPEVDFTWLAPQWQEGIARLVIVMDGQTYDYQPGGPPRLAMRWPGPIPGLVSFTAYDAAGKRLGKLEYQGDWAFFRALQAAGLHRLSDLRYAANLRFAHHAVRLVLEAHSLRHPFLNHALQQFRCTF